MKTILTLMAALVLTVLTSCEKEVQRYDEMRLYHGESLTLHQVQADSVVRFSDKVKAFVARYPAAAEDPLYPEIRANIRAALVTFTITVDDEWDGEIHLEY
jgi:hypothetical protein